MPRIEGYVHEWVLASEFLSCRIGGQVNFVIEPISLSDLNLAIAFAVNEGLPVRAVGSGKSILVPDGRTNVVMLQFRGALSYIQFCGVNEVRAFAGARLDEVIREAAARNLGGLEYIADTGVTIGSACVRNIATLGGKSCFRDRVRAVFYIAPRVPVEIAETRDPYNVPSDAIIVAVRLALQAIPGEKVLLARRCILQSLKDIKPVWLAALGPVWQDPPSRSAVELIHLEAHLPIRRAGGCEIIPKYPNHILNRAAASSANNVVELMRYTWERVRRMTGVSLTPAISSLGSFA